MTSRTVLQVLLPAVIFFMSCNKDVPESNCLELKDAMLQDDKSKAGQAITLYIKHLSSDDNTAENLQKLATLISAGQCSISAEVLCFGCIYTLPAQSEIRISFISGATTVSKTIDISYERGNNKMKFVSMHD